MKSGYEIEILNSSDPLEDWDRFVDISPQGSLFCRSWWLRTVCPQGFKILTLKQEGNIVAGMPLPIYRRWDGRIIMTPHFTQTLGVLLEEPAEGKYKARLSKDINMMSMLIEAMLDFSYFCINFHSSFTNWMPFYWAHYKQTTRYTYIIEDLSDLNRIYDDLSPKCRNRIRKADKCGITVIESDDVDLLLELEKQTYARQGLKLPYPADLLKQIDKECSLRGARKIFLAVDEGNHVHSGLCVVYDKKSLYCLIGGSDVELRDSGSNYLAMWHAIEFARTVSQRFDFEGSMMPNVEPFFRLFGAVQTPYFVISKDNRSMLIREADEARGIIKSALHLY